MIRTRPTRHDRADRARLDWLQERHDAQTVPCPDCAAPTGTTCTNPITGQPLRRAPAHPARIRGRTLTTARAHAAAS